MTEPDRLELQQLPDRLLGPADLARLFGVSKSTIRAWVRGGKLPAPLRIGRGPRWVPSSVRDQLV